jgi:TolB protein
MNADGSGQRNLTRSPAYDGNPAWSPDGRKIAFGRAGEVYVMNADGSGQRNLTRSPWNESSAAWSPPSSLAKSQ